MAVCVPQELLVDADCFMALSADQQRGAMFSLLCQLNQILDPVATCNIQTLLDDAACFMTLPLGQQIGIQSQLLCNVTAVISGLCGLGNPNGVIVGTYCGQSYLATDTSTKYQWNGTNWV